MNEKHFRGFSLCQRHIVCVSVEKQYQDLNIVSVFSTIGDWFCLQTTSHGRRFNFTKARVRYLSSLSEKTI